MDSVKTREALEAFERHLGLGNARAANVTAKLLCSADIQNPQLLSRMIDALFPFDDVGDVQALLEAYRGALTFRLQVQQLELKWRIQLHPDLLVEERNLGIKFPQKVVLKYRYLSKLLLLRRIDEAKEFVGICGLTTSRKVYCVLRLDLCIRLGWTTEIIEIADIVFRKQSALFDPQTKKSVALKVVRATGQAGTLSKIPESVVFFVNSELVPERVYDVNLKIKLEIVRGNWSVVRTLLARYPEASQSATFSHGKAWLRAHLGDIAGAKSVFQSEKHHFSYQALRRPCRVGELVKIDSRRLPVKAEIRLITVVRNEAKRIPWFLNYYRALGVDRFIFIDNGSSDTTRNKLLTQPDVHVFFTDSDYSKAASGMVWINHLVDRIGRRGWNLYADVDEALVFPGCESDGLDYLTGYMERHGHEALPSFMVDMHARRGFGAETTAMNCMDYEEAYPFFEARFAFNNHEVAPFYSVRGGGRRSMFDDKSQQSKVPLIRGGRNIEFLSSSHVISPAVISDVSSALLHFRMTDQFVSELKNDITHNQRGQNCRAREWGYLDQAIAQDRRPHATKAERFYENSDSLFSTLR